MRIIFLIQIIILLIPKFISAQLVEPKLSWDFYKNDKDIYKSFSAVTHFKIGYRHRIKSADEKNVVLEFKYIFKLDTTKSFFDFKKKYKDSLLLVHEQGHISIAYIYLKKLKREFEETKFGRDSYSYQAKEIYSRIMETAHNEQDKYDQETDHGKNRLIQEQWNNYFSEQRNISK